MNYLLDTHTLLWFFKRDNKLSQKARIIVGEPRNLIFISTASIWEIGIKFSIGKLDVVCDKVIKEAENAGFVFLPVINDYARIVADLPFHHRDPFDRLLVSTALAEGLTIITGDANIRKYDVPWVW